MEVLLQALRDRESKLGKADVQKAFESSEQKEVISQWIQEYLNPATLLSKDEASL